MFLDNKFYEICKKPSTCVEDDVQIAHEIHEAIKNHIKVQVFDQPNMKNDKTLITTCIRIDRQFRNAVKRLVHEGIDHINSDFVQVYFKKFHPEIAKHLYK